MVGSCDSALAIITRRFMPPDSVMIFASFLSHSDRSRSTFSMTAGSRGLPNRPRLNCVRVPDRLEHVGGELLRHEADAWRAPARKSRTMSWPSAMTVPVEAVTMPQMMLISVVLPAPFGPSSAKISPRRISRSTFLRAWKPVA